jgi:hypothetical protein
MKPREIVQRTLDYEYPERLAHSFEPSDFVWAGPEIPNPHGEWQPVGGGTWERTDEWGNIWRRLDTTSKGEIWIGAMTDLTRVESCPLPDFSRSEYYSHARQIYQDHPDLYHIGSIHGYTFSITRKLRRMEQYLIDLISDPERLSLLHDRVDEQIYAQMTRLSEAGADCIMLAEDWGTQLDLLISPRLWRKEFKPRFQALNDYAHHLGLKVFMHSCGKMTVIIPDLIETGIDLLQFDQPQIHGIDLLASYQDRAKITYWCPVDIQKTLQTKSETVIREEALWLVERLWRGRGGFVAGFYSDEASIGLDSKWQAMASDEFLKTGKYFRN